MDGCGIFRANTWVSVAYLCWTLGDCGIVVLNCGWVWNMYMYAALRECGIFMLNYGCVWKTYAEFWVSVEHLIVLYYGERGIFMQNYGFIWNILSSTLRVWGRMPWPSHDSSHNSVQFHRRKSNMTTKTNKQMRHYQKRKKKYQCWRFQFSTFSDKLIARGSCCCVIDFPSDTCAVLYVTVN